MLSHQVEYLEMELTRTEADVRAAWKAAMQSQAHFALPRPAKCTSIQHSASSTPLCQRGKEVQNKKQKSQQNSYTKLFCTLPRKYKSLCNEIIKQTDLATQLGLKTVSLVYFGPITSTSINLNTKQFLDSGKLYQLHKTAKLNTWADSDLGRQFAHISCPLPPTPKR